MSEFEHPIKDVTDSLLGWATQAELELAQRLNHPNVTIIGDLDLASDEVERIEKLYGIFLARQLAAGGNLAELTALSPALFLVTLTARAKKLVAADAFSREYLGGIGLSDLVPESQIDSILADKLAEYLTNMQVSAFDTDPVTVLCWHAGFVNTEIPQLLETIDTVAAKHDNPTIDDLELPHYFSGFYQVSPHAAILYQGVMALRDFTITHPQSWFDRDRKHLEPQLPTAIADAVAAELRERPVGTEDRVAAVGVANRELRPRLILDPVRKKVCLRLPEQRVPARGEITWRVSLEGSTTVYRTGRAWGDVTGYAESLDITLPRAVREVTVEDLSNHITWNVPVVNTNDPILLFNKRGGSVTDKKSLHHQRIRALIPAENRLVDVVHDMDIQPVSSFTIDGWDGWVCHNVILDGVDSLASLDAAATATQSDLKLLRVVDPRQRVTFRTPDEAIKHVTTLGGLKVHSQSLVAEFPPTPSGDTEIWHLSISAFGGAGLAGEEITQPEPLEVPAEGGVFHVLDPDAYDAPWVGEYLVRMRGPRNESFRHEFAIVEGMLAVTTYAGSSGSCRIPAGGGLSEATLIVKPGNKPFTAQPDKVHVSSQEAGADFVVSTEEGDSLPLRFNPPRLIFELPLLTEPPMWRASRMLLHPRMIDTEGTIRVRGAGELEDPKISVRNHHGQPVKTTKLTSRDGGITYVVPVSKLVSTTTVLSRGRIDLEWTDPSNNKRISVTLADVETTEPVAVTLDGGTLTVTGTEQQNLGVWVWPETAPWHPADTFPVVNNAVTLPEEYVDAGNLIVQVHVRDPFTVLHTPVSPGPEATVLEQEGFFGTDDGVLGTLSAFISGSHDTIPTDPQVMPVLWDMLASGGHRPETIKAVRTVFQANPDASLRGLSQSLVKSAQQPGRFIETGLVRCRFTGTPGSEAMDADLHLAAWIGTLELLGQLDHLFGAEGYPDAAKPQVEEVKKQLAALAGDNILETLKTARDTTLDSACIDKTTVMLAGMDPAQQRFLLNQVFGEHIVPGAVLDDSSRLLAVFETFNQRDKLRELLGSENLIASAVTLLRTLRSSNKSLYALARIRFDKLDGVDTNAKENLWALAPVVSLVLALASRVSAHGLITSNKTLDAATAGWARLAEVVPDLVISDIVAADAIALAIAKPGIA